MKHGVKTVSQFQIQVRCEPTIGYMIMCITPSHGLDFYYWRIMKRTYIIEPKSEASINLIDQYLAKKGVKHGIPIKLYAKNKKQLAKILEGIIITLLQETQSNQQQNT